MNIVLGVSGGIAAYKAPELVRRLRDAGADVRVILTPNAARFVSPLSLAAVSDHGVIVDQWGDSSQGGVDHIELARWADLLLIAPATANVIAKLASGIADDALTTYALAHRAAVMIAPAMNTHMLAHPTVARNIEVLRRDGAELIEPVNGLLACGEEGAGKMPDVPELVRIVSARFATSSDLEGVSILVTAGPTREPIDPVRYISNRSSGKMGYAIAAAASRRGARVTLVSGPVALPRPAGVERISVTTAAEMHDAVMQHARSARVVIKAAAVADFTPEEVSGQKIKKREGEEGLTLALRRNPDILIELSQLNPRPLLVAFAAETEFLLEHARQKLERKGADLIVANDVSDKSIGFDSTENEVTILDRTGGVTTVAKTSKVDVANRILDVVVEKLG
jgi:phosphopantothenoylcysteine decarboxylase/phosphopantothenate--cysteine ligase